MIRMSRARWDTLDVVAITLCFAGIVRAQSGSKSTPPPVGSVPDLGHYPQVTAKRGL
jgi:hypothetical protein